MRTKLLISISLLLITWLHCQAQIAHYRTITGRILFEDGDPVPVPMGSTWPPDLANNLNKHFRPVPLVQLLVKANVGGASYLIGGGYTDSQGNFSVIIPPYSVFPNIDLIVRIDNVAVRVWADTDGARYETLDGHIPLPVSERGNIDLGELMWPTDYFQLDIYEQGISIGTTVVSFAAAVNINEIILATRDDIMSNRDPSETDVIDQVDVEYGDETWNKYSLASLNLILTGAIVDNQVPAQNTGRLDYGFVDNTIAHEYAHHLQYSIGGWDGHWEDHSECREIDTIFNNDPEFAWNEGFADYIGLHMVFKPDGTLRPNRTSVGVISVDNQCSGLNPFTSNEDERWISVEGFVEGTLWDLSDTLGSGDDAWDHVDGTAIGAHNTIIQIFDNELDPWGGVFADAPDLIDFYEAWIGRTGTSDRERGQPALDPILNRFGIVPGGENNDVLRKMPPVAFVEPNPVLPDALLSLRGGTPVRQYLPPVYDPYSYSHIDLTIDRYYSYLNQSLESPDYDVFSIRIGVANIGAVTMEVDNIPGTNAQANSATFNATSNQPWLSVTPASGLFSPQTLTPLEIRFLPQVFNLSLGLHAADVNVQFNIMTNDGVQTQSRTLQVRFVYLDRPESDADIDGLTNQYEKENGLNPWNSDTDGDGLRDREEVNTYHTNPKRRDTDGDGFSDRDEIYCFSDQLLKCDCFNPLVFDVAAAPSSDPDGDGLTNREEKTLGTHPCRQDTDNDGVRDKEDNCPKVPNPPISPGVPQDDFDHDGEGDACDYDADNDGCPNQCDPNPLRPTPRDSCFCPQVDPRSVRGIFVLNALTEDILYILNTGHRPLRRPESCNGHRCPLPMMTMLNKKFEVIGEMTADQFGFDEQSGFGMASLILPDLDGDSVSEIAVAAPYAKSLQGHKEAGAVVIISSKTKKKLSYFEGTAPGATSGMALALLGNQEIAIGAPGSQQMPGVVYIVRLPDLKVARVLTVSEIGDEFGAAISSLKDYDGDGIFDLVVGAPNAKGKLPSVGAVYLSLSSGSLRKIGEGSETGDRFGSTVLYAGDTSGDNVPEILVGAPMAAKHAGSITLLSLSGRRLWTRTGNSSEECFGTAMAIVATDRIRGHAKEFLIGAPGAEFNGKKNAGKGYLLSAEGTSLGFIAGQEEGLELGIIVAKGPSFDNDGNNSFVLVGLKPFDGKYIGQSNFYRRKTKDGTTGNR